MPTFRRAGQGNIQQRLRQHSTCELVVVAITNLALHTTPPSLSLTVLQNGKRVRPSVQLATTYRY
jgi:hypothetical protein